MNNLAKLAILWKLKNLSHVDQIQSTPQPLPDIDNKTESETSESYNTTLQYNC